MISVSTNHSIIHDWSNELAKACKYIKKEKHLQENYKLYTISQNLLMEKKERATQNKGPCNKYPSSDHHTAHF